MAVDGNHASQWARRFVAGDAEVVEEFWQEYGDRLQRLADQHLTTRLQHRVGPDDVVQSACRTFFRRARRGDFELADREGLWRLLCAITVTKVRQQVRFHLRQKRTPQAEVPEDGSGNSSSTGPRDVVDPQSPPDEAVALADQLRQVMDALEAEEQQVVQLRLAECSVPEVAQQMQCSERTVRRMQNRVRSRLAGMLEDSCYHA